MLYGPNQGGRGRGVFLSYPRSDPTALEDSVGFQDSPDAPAIQATLADSAGHQDALTAFVVHVVLKDSIGLTDSPTTLTIGSATLIDSVGPQDALSFSLETAFAESFGPQDTIGALSIHVSGLSDSIGFIDAPLATTVLLGLLADSIGFTDSLISSAKRFLSVNARTGAITEYSFPFDVAGVGVVGGVLYVATASGLYALDATTDNGTAVAWEVRTGVSDFGRDKLKRLIDVNVTGKGASAIEAITSLASALGGKTEHRYLSVLPLTEMARGRVIKVGKGPRSVFWQVGVAGSGPAKIERVAVNAQDLSRRY